MVKRLILLSCKREGCLHVEPPLQYKMLSLSSSACLTGADTCPQSTRCSVLSQRPVQALLCQRSAKHLNSCHSSFRTFLGANASKTRRRTTSTPATNATDLPLVNAGRALFGFPYDQLCPLVSKHDPTIGLILYAILFQIQSEEDFAQALTQNKGQQQLHVCATMTAC